MTEMDELSAMRQAIADLRHELGRARSRLTDIQSLLNLEVAENDSLRRSLVAIRTSQRYDTATPMMGELRIETDAITRKITEPH